ncbi:efflux RND transporter periplasmic adaptor subunit [Duganella sp. sic0402]|uniref:efflux RND transporter periplasmic adaptor subunit n=1 Tax=Duganella sp. sic0402 TaxID=2854786 RepID=UPI001C449D74|nr:efflux RND transporter periplasmic adaptor subunit [Duganella sp. sic0402]MBV7534907.1 efflux RND transporter periplasmic adaptor subunit [Duganella sp. sic0402]
MNLKNWPALLAVVALAACSKGPQAEQKTPPPSVTVLALKPSSITLNDDLPGRVAAYRSADIRPQVGGIVLRRLFEQGTEVQAGQPLFQLNPAPLKAEFDTAAASLQHAQATLARASRQAERLQPLIDADAISRQAYDDAVSDRDLAAANVAQAKATLERKRLDLAFATVQAPISGRIGQELVSEGALVGLSDANPMARILQIDKVYVDVRQPASMLASLHAMREPGKQQAVILSAEGQPYKVDAKVLFADLNVDAGTGDATIRILVENPDRALLPGMFVRARIARAAPADALMVPQQAVQRAADGHASVWTLDKTGKAGQRNISVGEVINHQYLVRNGLAAGDTLVVEGQERLQEGAHAKPLPWKAPAQISASAPPSAAAAK